MFLTQLKNVCFTTVMYAGIADKKYKKHKKTMIANKILCVFHSADADGWACGAIFKEKFPQAMLLPYTYGENPNDIINLAIREKIEIIYMADVSMPYNAMNRINLLFEFHWIDHHKTAIEEMAPLKLRGSQDYKGAESGCSLLWKFLFNTPVPAVIEALRKGDIYEKDSQWTDIQSFKLLLQTLSMDERLGLIRLCVYIPKVFQEAINKGRVYSEYNDYLIAEEAKGAAPADFLGQPCFMINTRLSPGRVSEYILQKHECKFIVCWYQIAPGGGVKVSLRSNGQVDCGALAKSTGLGGGHPNAAGMFIPFEKVASML